MEKMCIAHYLNSDYLDWERQNQLTQGKVKETVAFPTPASHKAGLCSWEALAQADIRPVYLYTPTEFTFLSISATEAWQGTM